MSWKLVTAPLVEPVSLSEMKLHLKMDDITDDDALITSLITAARQNVESYCNIALIEQIWLKTYDRFERVMYLNKYPVSAVEISYYDQAGDKQELASSVYDVDFQNAPARIAVADNQTYPTTRKMINAVEIECTLGYGDAAADVPEAIKTAIKLLAAHLYEHRESVVIGRMTSELPMGVKYLLANYRSFAW